MSATLNSLEGMRAAVVLEDTVEALSFLSVITPDVRVDEVSALVGDEISRIISEQRSLERRYDVLIEERAQLKGLANKSKFKEVQAEIGALGVQLRESVKNLCRSLTDNPDIGDNLARIAEERDVMLALLERTLRDVRDGHYNSLAEFVRRETEQRERLAAVTQRESAAVADVEALAATLKEEEDKHAAEMDMKRAEISILKDKLRKLKVDTGLTLRYARKEVAARNEAAGRVNVVEEAGVAAQIEEVKQRLALEAAAHEASAEVLKAEQEEFARQAEEWKARHAADVAAKTEEIAALTAARDTQRAALEALQDRYEADLQAMVDKKVRQQWGWLGMARAGPNQPHSAARSHAPSSPHPPFPARRRRPPGGKPTSWRASRRRRSGSRPRRSCRR
jgi:hypothetical protein